MLQKIKSELWEKFKEIGKNAITMNHYDLHETFPEYTLTQWKDFLLEKDVEDFIKSENKILQTAELNKMLQNVANSRSVGQAQLINTLSKIQDEHSGTKEGPMFIYNYIPLDEHQAKASNIFEIETDPFLLREEDNIE